jgi:hypothetical protein
LPPGAISGAKMPKLDTLSQSFKEVNFYLVNVSGLTQGKTKMKEDPVYNLYQNYYQTTRPGY